MAASIHVMFHVCADCCCRVLRFLFTEINYGGRVTDDKDRRLVSNLITSFCGPQVLQEGYAFSPGSTYTVPGCETVAQVRKVGGRWQTLQHKRHHPQRHARYPHEPGARG